MSKSRTFRHLLLILLLAVSQAAVAAHASAHPVPDLAHCQMCQGHPSGDSALPPRVADAISRATPEPPLADHAGTPPSFALRSAHRQRAPPLQADRS